jgi:hypothetical protein
MSTLERRRRAARLIVGLALFAALPASAADVPVAARKLVVIDRPSVATGSRVIFVAKDPAVSKGTGTNPDDIGATITLAYPGGSPTGVVSIPAGTANGWRVNTAVVARYANKSAPGGPAHARAAVIVPGKRLALTAKALGLPSLDVFGAGPPAGAVRTAFCVTNGVEETCHCSEFTACTYKLIAGGTGAKLSCTAGIGDPGCGALEPPPTTTTTTTTAPTTTTTTTTTLPLGDEFDGVALDPSWSLHNPGLMTIDVSGGRLHLEATMSGGGTTWFNDSEGPLVYKAVTGDFDVRTVLSTEDAGSPGDPPPTQYRLAGLLARDPASAAGARDWVHVALGSGATAQGVCYEYKSTAASVSTWATIPTASPDGELRLVRTGAVFDLYWRPDGLASWLLIQSFARPDMPATLHVGLMVYATEAPPGIRASFDSIAFF